MLKMIQSTVFIATNNGVKDRMLKRHGCWVIESAEDGYIKVSFKESLNVSLSLGPKLKKIKRMSFIS